MKAGHRRNKTSFQRGHIPHNKGCKVTTEPTTNTPERWTRLPRELQENLNERLQQEPGLEAEVNVKLLRPAPPSTTYLDWYASPKHDRPNMDSYRILHAERTEKLWNDSMREHLLHKPDCTGQLIFDAEKEKKVGLAWQESLKCTVCDYISRKQKLYKEATSNNSQPGQKAANINLAAQAGLMTTSIGNTALRNILLHMNIPAPARKSMQRNSNRVNDIITKLNEENMREQRGQIIRNNKLLGLSEKTPIMMEADCMHADTTTP